MSDVSYDPLPAPPRPATSLLRGAWTAVAVLAIVATSTRASTQPLDPNEQEPRGDAPATLPQQPDNQAPVEQERPADRRNPSDLSGFVSQADIEEIFQSDLVSVKAIGTFSSRGRALAAVTRDRDDDQGFAGPSPNGLQPADPAELTEADLKSTIFALQSDSGDLRVDEQANAGGSGDGVESLFAPPSTGRRASREVAKMFWERAAGTETDYNDPNSAAVVASASTGGNTATSEVFIPLPAAVWSGLTVLCGVGLTAGLRRLRQRVR